MQRNSIHNPAPTENAQPTNPFPTSGNNFTTLVRLDGFPDDAAALEALAFLDDYAIALADFETSKHRTGTPNND